MDESKVLASLKLNPAVIRNIPHPTEAMMLVAVEKKGTVLQYIKEPSQAVIQAALKSDPKAIAYVDNPSDDLTLSIVKMGWNYLEYIQNPSEACIREALSQSGWAIRFVDNPSEDLQLLAVRQNYDALQYIKEPSEAVQLEAIKNNYQALRYISQPSPAVEKAAVLGDLQAIRLLQPLDQERALRLLSITPGALGYIPSRLAISWQQVEAALLVKLQEEPCDCNYIAELVRDGRYKEYGHRRVDLLQLIYDKGSAEAKRIALDYWLRA